LVIFHAQRSVRATRAATCPTRNIIEAPTTASGDQERLAEPLAVQAAHAAATGRSAPHVDDDQQDLARLDRDVPGGEPAPAASLLLAAAPAAGVDRGDTGRTLNSCTLPVWLNRSMRL
jgi:hypothetical protein